MKHKVISGLLAGCFCCASSGLMADSNLLVYVGTYTDRDSKGVYCFRFDTASGEIGPLELAGEAKSPSFLAFHPNGRFLYAVDEGAKPGAVNAFALDRESGALKLLNRETTGGTVPCHIILDRAGKTAIVSEYGTGSVSVFPVLEDGRIGKMSGFVRHEATAAQKEAKKQPRAHSTSLDPNEQFAFVADLGIDKIMQYRFDATSGKLSPNNPSFAELKPGAGPRHFCFQPGGRFAYAINELDSTLTAFSYDMQKGTLTEIQTLSSLPSDFKGKSFTAEVQVHPSGRFLYGSNRGHDSLAIFAIEGASGRLSLVGHESTRGKNPRHFAIDPTGKFLLAANQDSDNIVLLRIDPEKGSLSFLREFKAPRPVCLRFLPPLPEK